MSDHATETTTQPVPGVRLGKTASGKMGEKCGAPIPSLLFPLAVFRAAPHLTDKPKKPG